MKGYLLGYGYMGYLPSDGKYHEFETEEAYKEYYIEYEEAQSSSFSRDLCMLLYRIGGIKHEEDYESSDYSNYKCRAYGWNFWIIQLY